MTQAASFLPARTTPFDPPELLRELRLNQPLAQVPMWDGKPTWLVTRHADACTLLQDRRLSADSTNPNMPSMSPGQVAPMQRVNVARVDDPEHGRLRRAVSAEFMPSRLTRLIPTIENIVERRVDWLLAQEPPVEFVTAYALYIPSTVVSMLLGVPHSDLPFFQGRMLTVSDFYASTPEAIANADTELYEYIDALVSLKEREPGDDLISRMIRNEQEPLTHDEVANMAHILLSAGHTTTGNMTALSTLSLMTDPDLADTLRANPDLVENAVEELLRYHSVIQRGVRRFALADIQVGDTLIRQGEGILVLLPSANRDADVFTEPDQVDIHRDTRRHLAFGFGPHVCVGKSLARLELQVSVRTLTRRIPTLRLAVPFRELRFQEEMAHYGVRELPVTW